MEIFKLVGSVMVDTADADKSISKTSDKAEGLGNKFASGLKTAGKWAAGVVAGAVAVGGAMVKAAKSTAEHMDVIDKGSQRMKISAQSYQELAHAAELCGVEMSTMERAAKKLEGTDLNMDDALKQIYALETAEERSAKAAELFGDKVAYDMTPMLNASADEMAAMKQEAHDLGLVMSDEAVSNGAKMGDMFQNVEASLGALRDDLMAEFMPYIMEILQWIMDNLPMIKDTLKSVLDAVMPIVKPVLDAVMDLLPPIMSTIKKILDWIMPYLEPLLSAIAEAVKAVLALLNGDVEGFVNGMMNFLSGITSVFVKLGSAIIQALWDGMKKIWTGIANWFNEKIQWLKEKLGIVKNTAREAGNAAGGTSGAAGIPYVPYDNYPAVLHRGETVINRQEADEMREGGGIGTGTVINQYIQSVPQTPVELAAATASYFEQARWALA
jgi:phage-related protein